MYRILAICLLAGAIVVAMSAPALAAVARKHGKQPSPCSGGAIFGPGSREPMPLSGAPDPAILSRFAVLRRAAGPADQLPPLNPFGSQLDFQLASYYPGYIRQLAQLPDAGRIFLLLGFRRSFLPPLKCVPPRLRKRVLEQRKLESQLAYCVGEIGVSHRPFVSTSCLSFADIETGGALAASALSTAPVVDLVPDGVATVRLSYRNGATIAGAVHENTLIFTPPQGPIKRAKRLLHGLERKLSREEGEYGNKAKRRRLEQMFIRALARTYDRLPPRQVQWLDSAGHVLRSFAPHQGASRLNVISIVSGAGAGNLIPIG
jgi:hypothetical protein